MAYNRFAKNSFAKPVKQARAIRSWSKYQEDIFADIASGKGNTQVDALAGTGKTSTIVEGFYHAPKDKSILMCAFNKSIQTELESRAPEGIDIKTLHSLGYAACRRAFPKIGAPDKNKLDGYIKAEIGEEDNYEFRSNVAKLVSLCKGYLAHSYNEIDEVIDRHDIETNEHSREFVVTLALKLLDATKRDTNRVDFDDMVWLPNVLNLKLPKYGMVFIDEAQDLNNAQINLALNSIDANGRIISVGDRNQAIYGFRGADSNAIQNIVDRCNSKRLPLSVTYRCAKAIVQMAQSIVPEIEAASSAQEGIVENISENNVERMVKPGDFILSRANAPLIKWCLTLLKSRIPANIQGRDLGKNLNAMIKKSKANSVESFLTWLDEYEGMEVMRLAKIKRSTDIISDKAECLRILCDGARTLNEVQENMDKLFKDGDDTNRVILSSIHRSKGLERDRVFVLNNTLKIGKNQEESNLGYVAYTRAKRELYLVG